MDSSENVSIGAFEDDLLGSSLINKNLLIRVSKSLLLKKVYKYSDFTRVFLLGKTSKSFDFQEILCLLSTMCWLIVAYLSHVSPEIEPYQR